MVAPLISPTQDVADTVSFRFGKHEVDIIWREKYISIASNSRKLNTREKWRTVLRWNPHDAKGVPYDLLFHDQSRLLRRLLSKYCVRRPTHFEGEFEMSFTSIAQELHVPKSPSVASPKTPQKSQGQKAAFTPECFQSFLNFLSAVYHKVIESARSTSQGDAASASNSMTSEALSQAISDIRSTLVRLSVSELSISEQQTEMESISSRISKILLRVGFRSGLSASLQTFQKRNETKISGDQLNLVLQALKPGSLHLLVIQQKKTAKLIAAVRKICELRLAAQDRPTRSGDGSSDEALNQSRGSTRSLAEEWMRSSFEKSTSNEHAIGRVVSSGPILPDTSLSDRSLFNDEWIWSAAEKLGLPHKALDVQKRLEHLRCFAELFAASQFAQYLQRLGALTGSTVSTPTAPSLPPLPPSSTPKIQLASSPHPKLGKPHRQEWKERASGDAYSPETPSSPFVPEQGTKRFHGFRDTPDPVLLAVPAPDAPEDSVNGDDAPRMTPETRGSSAPSTTVQALKGTAPALSADSLGAAGVERQRPAHTALANPGTALDVSAIFGHSQNAHSGDSESLDGSDDNGSGRLFASASDESADADSYGEGSKNIQRSDSPSEQFGVDVESSGEDSDDLGVSLLELAKTPLSVFRTKSRSRSQSPEKRVGKQRDPRSSVSYQERDAGHRVDERPPARPTAAEKPKATDSPEDSAASQLRQEADEWRRKYEELERRMAQKKHGSPKAAGKSSKKSLSFAELVTIQDVDTTEGESSTTVSVADDVPTDAHVGTHWGTPPEKGAPYEGYDLAESDLTAGTMMSRTVSQMLPKGRHVSTEDRYVHDRYAEYDDAADIDVEDNGDRLDIDDLPGSDGEGTISSYEDEEKAFQMEVEDEARRQSITRTVSDVLGAHRNFEDDYANEDDREGEPEASSDDNGSQDGEDEAAVSVDDDQALQSALGGDVYIYEDTGSVEQHQSSQDALRASSSSLARTVSETFSTSSDASGGHPQDDPEIHPQAAKTSEEPARAPNSTEVRGIEFYKQQALAKLQQKLGISLNASTAASTAATSVNRTNTTNGVVSNYSRNDHSGSHKSAVSASSRNDHSGSQRFAGFQGTRSALSGGGLANVSSIPMVNETNAGEDEFYANMDSYADSNGGVEDPRSFAMSIVEKSNRSMATKSVSHDEEPYGYTTHSGASGHNSSRLGTSYLSKAEQIEDAVLRAQERASRHMSKRAVQKREKEAQEVLKQVRLQRIENERMFLKQEESLIEEKRRRDLARQKEIEDAIKLDDEIRERRRREEEAKKAEEARRIARERAQKNKRKILSEDEKKAIEKARKEREKWRKRDERVQEFLEKRETERRLKEEADRLRDEEMRKQNEELRKQKQRIARMERERKMITQKREKEERERLRAKEAALAARKGYAASPPKASPQRSVHSSPERYASPAKSPEMQREERLKRQRVRDRAKAALRKHVQRGKKSDSHTKNSVYHASLEHPHTPTSHRHSGGVLTPGELRKSKGGEAWTLEEDYPASGDHGHPQPQSRPLPLSGGTRIPVRRGMGASAPTSATKPTSAQNKRTYNLIMDHDSPMSMSLQQKIDDGSFEDVESALEKRYGHNSSSSSGAQLSDGDAALLDDLDEELF